MNKSTSITIFGKSCTFIWGPMKDLIKARMVDDPGLSNEQLELWGLIQFESCMHGVKTDGALIFIAKTEEFIQRYIDRISDSK